MDSIAHRLEPDCPSALVRGIGSNGMAAAAAGSHAKLLRELRAISVGPPDIAHASPVAIPGGRLAQMWPVLAGAGKTAMVRSFLAMYLGLLLLGRALWSGRSAGGGAAIGLVGLFLMAYGFVGLPGGVPVLAVRTAAGFYCKGDPNDSSTRNARIRHAFQGWLARFSPTPFVRTGELCTVCPFLWSPNRCVGLAFERVWLQLEDEERMAVDWVFPPGGYDPSRPVVFLLTGLAPSKHWTVTGGFVGDAAWHLSTRLGMTAVVVVARGTMDTEVQKHLFHGARVTDLRQAILMAEKVTRAVAQEADKPLGPPIFAAGFSMGAIILGNYCGQYGQETGLKGAVHFSGVYDAVFNMKFEYSVQTWQTYLTYGLKTSFFTDRTFKEAVRRGVNMPLIFSRSTASVVDIDTNFVAPYNGYPRVEDYYLDMSLGAEDKWRKVAIPVLAVAARDDPITHCDALRAQEFSAENENLLFLITDRGGHVGWPWGSRPWSRGFDFMNEGIGLFIETILADT
mmetsp:Transcript_86177/g.278456  ORF Transcript_86177/g.278456 Transcript_86177/m.278456 type:complete len:510 (+) Transcript_86177:1-1530(+)